MSKAGSFTALPACVASPRTTPTYFCTVDQVKEEVGKVIDLVLYIFKTLDFVDFVAQVSLRDPGDPGEVHR